MEEKIVFNTQDVEQNKAFAVLSYIPLLFLVPLLVAKDSAYARFHANQGLVLFIFEIICLGITSVLSRAFGIIPILGGIVNWMVSLLIGIIELILTILGIVNACSGDAKKLPIIGAITIIR